jgi:hypothetical protein
MFILHNFVRSRSDLLTSLSFLFLQAVCAFTHCIVLFALDLTS